MPSSNIKRFNQLVGGIFSDLYKSFPVPVELMFDDYTEEKSGVQDLDLDFFYASINWLSDAGYLTFKATYLSEGFAGCVLTTKGLETLKAVPGSITTAASLGDQLVEASKNGAKGLLADIAGQAISVGVRIASSHLGLPG